MNKEAVVVVLDANSSMGKSFANGSEDKENKP